MLAAMFTVCSHILSDANFGRGLWELPERRTWDRRVYKMVVDDNVHGKVYRDFLDKQKTLRLPHHQMLRLVKDFPTILHELAEYRIQYESLLGLGPDNGGLYVKGSKRR